MPKRITPLSDLKVSKSKPKESDFKLNDGYGLYLLVSPTGGKLWRFDYRYEGKRKTAAFGAYPAVSLADARQRRDAAKKSLANGVHDWNFAFGTRHHFYTINLCNII